METYASMSRELTGADPLLQQTFWKTKIQTNTIAYTMLFIHRQYEKEKVSVGLPPF